MGSPLTLAQSGTNDKISKNDANHASGVVVGCGSGTGCIGSGGGGFYTLAITNTTDNSERLRIIHSAEQASHATDTKT